MLCEHCGHPIRKTIPDDLKKKVVELFMQGFSCRDIGTQLNIGASSASRIVRAHNKKTGRRAGGHSWVK
jgi:transposase